METLDIQGSEVARPISQSAPLRLALALDHRQWLDLLADEWWSTQKTGAALHLGVGYPINNAVITNRKSIIAWIDPARLPTTTVPILRNAQWCEISLTELRDNDQEVAWPGPIPLFAIESFSTSNESDQKWLLAYAKGYAGLASVEQIHIEQHPVRISTEEVPQNAMQMRPPHNWDALRGAAAMAVWAVPPVKPWLDVLCNAFAFETNTVFADALRAPWWNETPWRKQQASSLPCLALSLWRAMLDALQEVNIREGWQPFLLLDRIVERTLASGINKNEQASLADLATETRAILQDRQSIDVNRGVRDPLGLTLQLILLRPKPEQFATWREHLLAMPPVVWWTGAMLSGFICGFRNLDSHYSGSSTSRRLLALSTWQLATDLPSADTRSINPLKAWPNLLEMQPSWETNGSTVTLTWDGQPWAERKENSRGKWYMADLGQDKIRQAAIHLARKLCPPSLYAQIRIKDRKVAFTGNPAINVQGQQLDIAGEMVLQLPHDTSIEHDLNDAAFRDWLLHGSIPELLDAPPQGDSALSNPVEDSLSKEVEDAQTSTETIPGLRIIPNFMSLEQEQKLIKIVDQAPWLNDLKRRVQHYGWKYNYKARKITREAHIGPLPSWAQALAQRLLAENWVSELPDQVIVNEYVANQSISKHIDCVSCFRGPIVTLSLNESWEMIFRKLDDSKEKIARVLEQRSATILNGDARNNWTHEIPKRQKEPSSGKKRGRRISLTFRKVNID